MNMTETVVSFTPEVEWRPGMTREKLIAELAEATTLPGVSRMMMAREKKTGDQARRSSRSRPPAGGPAGRPRAAPTAWN